MNKLIHLIEFLPGAGGPLQAPANIGGSGGCWLFLAGGSGGNGISGSSSGSGGGNTA